MSFGYLLNSYTASLQSSFFFMDEGTVFGMRNVSMVPTLSLWPRSFFESTFEASGPSVCSSELFLVLLFTFTPSAHLESVVCPWLKLAFCSFETH